MRKPRLSPRFVAAATRLVLVLPVVYFTTLYSAPIYGTYFYPQRVRSQWLVAALLIGWLVWKWRRRAEFAHTSIDAPVSLLLIAVGTSALGSTDRRLSLEVALGAISCVLAFYFLLDLVRYPNIRSALIDAVLIVALLACLEGLYHLGRWYWALPEPLRAATWRPLGSDLPPPRLSVLANPNILAAYLVIVLPLGAYRWSRIGSRLGRALGAAALGAGLLVLLLTRSRGGVIGLLAAILTGLWSARHHLDRRRAAVLAGLSLVTLIGAGLVLAERGVQLTEGSGEVRIESWRVALLVLRDRPFLGSGPGTFGRQLVELRDPLRLQEVHAHAHNMYLTLAAETGLVGALLAAWLAGAFILALHRGRHAPEQGFTLDRACIAGLMGWGTHSLVDSFLDKPVIPLHALLLAAVALSYRGRVAYRPAVLRTAALTVVCAVLGVAAVWVNLGFGAFHNARLEAYQENWEAARRWMDKAVAMDPHNWFYGSQRALAYGHVACEDAAWVDRAIAAYAVHLNSFDAWAPDHANLAALWAEAGEYRNAVESISRAQQLDPTEATYDCLRGRYLESDGQPGPALEAFSACLARSPRLASSSFWEETRWRSEARPRILRRAIDLAGQEGDLLAQAILYAAAGNPDTAMERVRTYRQAHPDDVLADVTEARVLQQTGDVQQARALLEATATRVPGAREVWLLLGHVYLESGEAALAAQAADVAGALGADARTDSLAAKVAEMQGDIETALSAYRRAVDEVYHSPVSSFAPWVAHRLPLGAEWLPCLRPPRPRDVFAEPALALGRLLENQGRCLEAAQVYELVLSQEPALKEAQERLGRLTCVGR